ncbi:uncharacterized protein L201_001602 [Kwoniella dendrophila CBS 6074]|uniref:Uncharacterized protein n=1 Tax=Kwoniella dendrophila CBS 6074 TaxID=1295534 RepID=A0AAX4JPP8_9TREE
MEFTEENAEAGDQAYLNLILLQTLGSDRSNLIWCSVWGLIVQSNLLGILVYKILKIINNRKRCSKWVVGVIICGLIILLIQLGITIDQSYRLTFTGDSSSIAIDDSRRNIGTIVICGILSTLNLVYGSWLIWNMGQKKRFVIPTTIGITISLRIILGIAIVTYQIPIATVSKMFLIKEWVKKQGILLRVWSALLLVLHGQICLTLGYLIRSMKKMDKSQKMKVICEALILPIAILAISLIYSAVEIPSFANAFKPLIQSLPALFLFSFIHLLSLSYGFKGKNNGRLSIDSSAYYYTTPQIDIRKGLLPSSSSDTYSYSGYTSSSTSASTPSSFDRGFKNPKDYRESFSDSVVMTVDTLGSESKTLSPPPSAYSFGSGSESGSGSSQRSKLNHRYIPSPLPSPLHTPKNPEYTDIPLSIIAPFSEWLNQQNPNAGLPSNEDDTIIEQDTLSYKSAVPSGKTLLRTKSERSKKDRGIILDHTGWNRILNQDNSSFIPIPNKKRSDIPDSSSRI